jgi:hypothetical protein
MGIDTHGNGPLHAPPHPRHGSHARGAWWSHGLASDQRSCTGTASRRPQASHPSGGARPRPTRGEAPLTTGTPALPVGSRASATRASRVCDVGARGVCDEVYARGGHPGYRCLCAQGRSDGCSPEDVALCLTFLGEVCAAVADDQCTTVTRLQRDWAHGRCAAAFSPQPFPQPCPGTADATSTARGS